MSKGSAITTYADLRCLAHLFGFLLSCLKMVSYENIRLESPNQSPFKDMIAVLYIVQTPEKMEVHQFCISWYLLGLRMFLSRRHLVS